MSIPGYPPDHILGLLSDSHGRADITRQAVDLLIRSGAQTLIHLGDICDDRVLDALAGEHEVRIVFGNCDDHLDSAAEYARFIGLNVDHPVGRIRIGEKLVVFAHGDHDAHLRAAVAEGAEYFLHGHTHETRDERVGRTRLVNPGALSRASRYTVAWLEPLHDRLRFLDVERL